MHLDWRKEDSGLGGWRKTWKRGIKMRRNVVAGNFQVGDLYSGHHEFSRQFDRNLRGRLTTMVTESLSNT